MEKGMGSGGRCTFSGEALRDPGAGGVEADIYAYYMGVH